MELTFEAEREKQFSDWMFGLANQSKPTAGIAAFTCHKYNTLQ